MGFTPPPAIPALLLPQPGDASSCSSLRHGQVPRLGNRVPRKGSVRAMGRPELLASGGAGECPERCPQAGG